MCLLYCRADQCFLADSVESTVLGHVITRCAQNDCTLPDWTLKDGNKTYTKDQIQAAQWDVVKVAQWDVVQ
eukprot:gene31323-6468_t